MVNKILRIFRKEIKVGLRDGMILLILVIPVLLAVGIALFSPGITDGSLQVALLDSDTTEHRQYLDRYVQVEQFQDLEQLKERVNRNDDIIGLVKQEDGYQIIIEGNEAEGILEYAQWLNVYYEHGATEASSTAQILSFEHDVSPLKGQLANMLIILIIMFAGMVISLSLVEEKKDQTIRAMNVAPVTQTSFILGKCLLGGMVAMIGIVSSLLVLGYTDINWWLILLVGANAMLPSFVIGLLQGLAADDVIEAAGGVKLTLIPIAGSIAGYLFLAREWQWTMYWSPFYWAYQANDLILSHSSDWATIALSTGAIVALSLLIYGLAMPKIRKGLR